MTDDNEMVGRILTVDRVKQLNSRRYFYSMLKDNPAIVEIEPGVEDEILVGAIDCHIHASPDFVPRSQDMLQIAVEGAKAKMRAVVFKDHYNLTAGAAYMTQRAIDEMVLDGRLDHRIEVYGGLGLNLGATPEAVRIGLKYSNFATVWFPTFRSYGWARFAGVEDREDYIRLVDDDGKVYPNIRAIMEMCAEANVCIGLGHTDYEELLPLCTLANEIGVRTVLDHPLLELNKLTLEEMITLADLGTYVGTYCQPMIPSLYQPIVDPYETVDTIKAVGAQRCVAGSDFGQVLHVDTIDGMRIFIRALLGFGIPKEDVRTVVKGAPEALLGLEPADY